MDIKSGIYRSRCMAVRSLQTITINFISMADQDVLKTFMDIRSRIEIP